MQDKNTTGIDYSNGANRALVGDASPRRGRRVLLFAVLLLLIAGGLGLLFFYLNKPTNGQFNNSQLDLSDIAQSNFKDTDKLSIFGQLNIEGGFAIAPSSRPSDPQAGQLYYDQSSNFLSYYNGTEFINLTGDELTVGDGLTNTDGIIINSGVLSLQGATGNVTLTAGDGITITGTTISATAGGVGGSGTAGRVAKFTGPQTIGNSLLTESGTTISVSGDLAVTGGLSLTTALTAANGGTGASSLTANGVLVGNGTGAISSVVAGGAGLCLQSTAGAPTFAACPGGGGGVTSLNGLSGALSIANASAAGSTVTIDNATNAAKGIASFNGTNFSVAAGAVNTIQDIATSASPTFVGMTLTGDLAVNGGDVTSTGGLTIVSGGAGNITLNSAAAIDLQDSTTVTGDLTVRDSSTPTKQYRFRTSGGSLDLESGGASLHLSTWDNADFTGTQRKRLVLVNGSNLAVVLGEWDWYTSEFGSLHHQIRSDSHVVFNNDNLLTNLTIKGGTDSNLFFAEGFTDRIGIGTITPGHKLDVNGTLGVAGLVTLTSAGAADTSTYLCRNSSNQIATCNSGGAGVAFVNGGNSFGGATSIGTNDGNDLAIERGGVTQLTVGNGAVTFASGVDLIMQGSGAYISNAQGSVDSEAFGNSADVTANGAMAIGAATSADFIGSIAIGAGAATTATNQLVIGGSTYYINKAILGNGVANASPQNVTLQGTSGSGTDIAGATVTIAGGQSTGSAFGGSIQFQISDPGVSGTALNGLTTVASIGGATGAVLFQNSTDSTQALRVQTSGGNNVMVIDTTNGRVGIGASAVPTLDNSATGLNVSGAVRISGTANVYDRYTTPGGAVLDVRFGINNVDVSAFDQVVAFGLTATSDSTARGLMIADARTVNHQPSIAVLSPNENNIGGFSWDGSNTAFAIKNTNASGSIQFDVGGVILGSADAVSGITFGAASLNSPIALNSGTGTISVGTGAQARTINVGTGAAAQTITVGSTNTTSSLSLLAGSGGVTLNGTTLSFQTSSAVRMAISSTGDITIGTSDTTGSLLVLDTKTGAGDPTGADGGMYYNSNAGKFRCYEAGAWTDCIAKQSQTVIFTSSSTFDKANYPGLKSVVIEVQGAGGGSGGVAATGVGEAAQAGGAGGGGYCKELLLVSALATSETVTVGTGGGGGAAGANDGSSGGNSSFGAHCTGGGGEFGRGMNTGTTSADAVGGTGGTASGGDINIPGSAGGYGLRTGAYPARNGFGGASHLGGSNRVTASGSGGNGTSGNQYGGGAAGAVNPASQAARSGGTGADGIVIVTLNF